MGVLRGVFACLFLIFYCVLCKQNSVKWLRNKTTGVTYGNTTRVEGALSTSQCMAKCLSTEGCEAVNVHRDNLQCELSTHHPKEGGLTENQRPGWTVYYYTRNCMDQMASGDKTTGFKTIIPDGINPVRALCIMDEFGGGWTVIQKRESASDFYKNWQDYKNGFGDDTNFWLGLENIHRLTAQGNFELRIDMKKNDNQRAAAIYKTFSIGNEEMLYKLSIGNYSFDPAFNDPGDSFLYHNGMKFTTFDNDNDGWLGNCAENLKSGYWYRRCQQNNLNGVYGSATSDGIIWGSWRDYVESLKYTRMMIRPN